MDFVQVVVHKKLRMIYNAENINDLRIPPANRLKKLKGELSNYYSIRINDQWRIIFIWKSNHAEKVQLTDYHE